MHYSKHWSAIVLVLTFSCGSAGTSPSEGLGGKPQSENLGWEPEVAGQVEAGSEELPTDLLALANRLAQGAANRTGEPMPETNGMMGQEMPPASELEPEPGLERPRVDLTQLSFPEPISCLVRGANQCREGSCCEQIVVDTWEAFLVEEGKDSLIDPFVMDKYEVTVGRFREFVADYDTWREAGNPQVAAGEHPQVPGTGWQAMPDELAQTQSLLLDEINCDGVRNSWNSSIVAKDSKPMNCLSWYTAFAFCIWDGGRLPTEMEWLYAATGGDLGWQYPWGSTPEQVTDQVAVYGCVGESCNRDDILPVGSREAGDSRYGHADMVGSVFEWVFDWYAPFPESLPENFVQVASGTERGMRGGSWRSSASDVLSSTNRSMRGIPVSRSSISGVRCVRDFE